MGDFKPDAQVNGETGLSSTAFIFSKNSATFSALCSLFMAQKYKVYFANRPVFFTQKEDSQPAVPPGVERIVSQLRYDTMLIEDAIGRGAKEIQLLCDDVEKSWSEFKKQFSFIQAAGGVVQNPIGEVLFIYRHERWDLPKGKVEEGEQLEEAALREVEEECSVSHIELGDFLLTTWHTYIQNGEPMLKATTWYRMKFTGDETPSPQAIEGITETRWISSDALEEPFSNTYASVVDVMNAFLA